MDSSVSATLSPADEQQALIIVQVLPEHEPTEATEGAGAVADAA
jgi:hypothetical protein